MFNRTALLLALSLAAFGVQAAKPVPLALPIAPALPVEVIESQQEMGVTVSQTASAVGMQFGLVGAIIGTAVQNAQAKKAEERVVPLRNLLVDYRFNQKMAEALRAKLPSEGVSPDPVLTVMATPWEAHDAQQSGQLPPLALVITPSYSMDSDFSQMTVNLRAQVNDRVVKSNGKIKSVPRFSRNYAFQYPMIGQSGQDPVQDWLAFGAPGMAQLLDQAIAQTTDMLVHDLSAEGREAWGVDPKGQNVFVAGQEYSGAPVRQGEGWAWVRTGRKQFQSLQGYQPLTAGVALASAPVAQPAADAVAQVQAETTPVMPVEARLEVEAQPNDPTLATVAVETAAEARAEAMAPMSPPPTAAPAQPATSVPATEAAPVAPVVPTGG